MGIDPAIIAKSRHGRAALIREAKKRGTRAALDSNLEARFIVLLKQAKVPEWTRDQKIPALGTKHEADFLWRDVPRLDERKKRIHLAVFIDGAVHGLRKNFPDTLRCVNLCAFLDLEWTVLRFAETQLEIGARAVALWHLGRMRDLITLLRETT